jgi:hypothetical protein
MKSSDVDANNAPLNPLPTVTGGVTYNTYFNIAMDSDYDGILGVGNSAVTTMPNFSAATWNSTSQTTGGSSTAGVAVWANCNASSSQNVTAFWVHTY